MVTRCSPVLSMSLLLGNSKVRLCSLLRSSTYQTFGFSVDTHNFNYSRNFSTRSVTFCTSPRNVYTLASLNLHKFSTPSVSHSSTSTYSGQTLPSSLLLTARQYCTSQPDKQDPKVEEQETKKMGIMERFKSTYKQYGKLFIAVHVTSSICWFSLFYLIVYSGLDVGKILSYISLSDTLTASLHGDGVGTLTAALVIYKICFPIRDLFSITATLKLAKFLRKQGYMPPIAEQDRIRNLVKDASKSQVEKAKVYSKSQITQLGTYSRSRIAAVHKSSRDDINRRASALSTRLTKSRTDALENVKVKLRKSKADAIDNVRSRLTKSKTDVMDKFKGKPK